MKWRAVSGFVAAMLLACCAPAAQPLSAPTIVQQSTGLEYQILSLSDFTRSPIQSPRFYYKEGETPDLAHRRVAVLLPVAGCRSIGASMRQFVEVTSGQSLGMIMRRDPRGDGKEGVLHDPATEAGVIAFRNPALTVESVEAQIEACERYAAAQSGLIQPIFLVLIGIEDSTSGAALFDRYVEDIVFAQTHADVGAWALQQIVAGIVLP